MAAQNRVPLFRMEMPTGLWLMNKGGLLQLEHFNKSNALSWALTMGLFAMPVIYSDREWSQIVGESYYIQLSPGDKFGWAEPEGKVYQIASDNLSDSARRDLPRVLSEPGGRPAFEPGPIGSQQAAGLQITQEVLRAYGDTVKDVTRRVLTAIEEARQDGLVVGVSGLDEFDIADFSSELDDAQRLLSLGIQSPTMKKQIFKKLAMKYLCDLRAGCQGTDRVGNRRSQLEGS